MERPVKIVTVTDSQTTSNGYVLLEGRDAIVIDPNLEGEIAETLEKYQAVPGLAILTHEHADHIRGLEALRERYPQMRTVASLLCSERIQDIRSNLSRIFGVYLMFIPGERVLDYPKFTCRAADVMFEGRLLFSWHGRQFALEGIPGHSPGSIGILAEGIGLFTGDSLLGDRPVITRFDGGSRQDYERVAVPYFQGLDPGLTVYPGHGEPFLLRDGILRDDVQEREAQEKEGRIAPCTPTPQK